MSIEITSSEIDRLLSVANESARQGKDTVSHYIDMDGNKAKVAINRHTVIFGRRGSGKTSLLKTLRADYKIKRKIIWLDADQYKRLIFPDILIQIFRASIQNLERMTIADRTLWHFKNFRRSMIIVKNLRKADKRFQILLEDFEKSETKRTDNLQAATGKKKSIAGKVANLEGEASSEYREKQKTETVKTGINLKIQDLDRQFQDFKSLIDESISWFGDDIYLVLDDFYHLGIADQSQVLDYLGRLLKNTRCYIKIGTISHRSNLYSHSGEEITGLQLGHDIDDINLDRSFKSFDAVDSFLSAFCEALCNSVGVGNVKGLIFAGDSWRQLILASGGVPRDFLNILRKAIEVGRAKHKTKIDQYLIFEAAALLYRETKRSDLNQDRREGQPDLEHLLKHISDFCILEKKKNVFLVPIEDLEKRSAINESFKQLSDFRFIHEIDENTSSAKRSVGRFRAYLLDVGIYAYPQRRGANRVQEIQFWVKDANKSYVELRNSPIYEIIDNYSQVTGDPFELPAVEEESTEDAKGGEVQTDLQFPKS